MLSEQEQIRRESLKKIIDYGINPYPAKEFKFSHYSKQILENYIADTPYLELVSSCKNAFEVLEVLEDKPIDVVF